MCSCLYLFSFCIVSGGLGILGPQIFLGTTLDLQTIRANRNLQQYLGLKGQELGEFLVAGSRAQHHFKPHLSPGRESHVQDIPQACSSCPRELTQAEGGEDVSRPTHLVSFVPSHCRSRWMSWSCLASQESSTLPSALKMPEFLR